MKDLNINGINGFDGKIVSEKEFNMIEESELITDIENCGNSGKYMGATWWNITLTDGTEISIYTRAETN